MNVDGVYACLTDVTDPEIPALTIIDMGIVRDVKLSELPEGGTEVTIKITATYTGCPAMDIIGMNIRMALLSHGMKKVNVEQQISPAWTTDWMTADGKRKLKEYGIAPPQRNSSHTLALFEEVLVPCPRCESSDTSLISQFGATACKSLYKCNACKEPFEYFKCH
ncbi:MAG: 1,2-phenylacetyl-CoA epoxidase subunit PaaD [Bacteroidota bacterium]